MAITLFLLLVSVFFFVLWGADIFFTLKSVEKKGRHLEANPIIKALFGLRRTYFWAFKSIEIAAFLFLVYFISTRDANEAVTVLFSITAVYTLVVAQGIHVYLTVVKNTTPVIALFIAVSLLSITFLWVNYVSFLNTGIISNALTRCGAVYAHVYSQCFRTPPTENVTNAFRDSGLNLTIPR